MTFTTAEAVVRDVIEDFDATQQLILDFKRVLTLNESACRLFYEVLIKLVGAGQTRALHALRPPAIVAPLHEGRLGKRFEKLFQPFDDNDLALEWCENRLLRKNLAGPAARRRAAIAKYELCEKFTAGELKTFASFLQRRSYQARRNHHPHRRPGAGDVFPGAAGA